MFRHLCENFWFENNPLYGMSMSTTEYEHEYVWMSMSMTVSIWVCNLRMHTYINTQLFMY